MRQVRLRWHYPEADEVQIDGRVSIEELFAGHRIAGWVEQR